MGSVDISFPTTESALDVPGPCLRELRLWSSWNFDEFISNVSRGRVVYSTQASDLASIPQKVYQAITESLSITNKTEEPWCESEEIHKVKYQNGL